MRTTHWCWLDSLLVGLLAGAVLSRIAFFKTIVGFLLAAAMLAGWKAEPLPTIPPTGTSVVGFRIRADSYGVVGGCGLEVFAGRGIEHAVVFWGGHYVASLEAAIAPCEGPNWITE